MKKIKKITKILLIIIFIVFDLIFAGIFALIILDRTDIITNLPAYFGQSRPTSTSSQKPLVFDLTKQNNQTSPQYFLPQVATDYSILETMLTTRQNNFTSQAPLNEGKIIEIDLSSQRFLAWDNGKLLGNWLTSTGIAGRDTRVGVFAVLDKYELATGVGPDGEYWEMPKWLGIYYAGSSENGIHALARVDGYQVSAGVLSAPSTNGCITLAYDVAKKIYDWVNIGTLVMIHW